MSTVRLEECSPDQRRLLRALLTAAEQPTRPQTMGQQNAGPRDRKELMLKSAPAARASQTERSRESS